MSAFFIQIAEAEAAPRKIDYAKALRDAKLAVRNKAVDGKKPSAVFLCTELGMIL